MTTRQPDPLPEATAQFALPDGRPVAVWYRWFWDVANMIPKIIAIIDNPPPPPVYEVEMIEEFSVVIEFPENGDYDVALDAAIEREIYEVVTKTKTGTCTVTVKIDTTALGGSANSASTSQQIQTHSTTNVWAVDKALRATISSASSCERLTITAKTRRTIPVTLVP